MCRFAAAASGNSRSQRSNRSWLWKESSSRESRSAAATEAYTCEKIAVSGDSTQSGTSRTVQFAPIAIRRRWTSRSFASRKLISGLNTGGWPNRRTSSQRFSYAVDKSVNTHGEGGAFRKNSGLSERRKTPGSAILARFRSSRMSIASTSEPAADSAPTLDSARLDSAPARLIPVARTPSKAPIHEMKGCATAESFASLRSPARSLKSRDRRENPVPSRTITTTLPQPAASSAQTIQSISISQSEYSYPCLCRAFYQPLRSRHTPQQRICRMYHKRRQHNSPPNIRLAAGMRADIPYFLCTRSRAS